MDDMSLRIPAGSSLIPDIAGPSSEAPSVGPIPSGDGGALSFKDTVKQLLSDVNDKLETSDQNVRDLAAGRTNDVEKVVSSVEEANLALQYTMAIRTKLIDAYQEISRMQF